MESSTVSNIDSFANRRNSSHSNANLWASLSLSQKFSTSSLTKFGYDLAFIRNKNTDNSLAILTCGTSIATINAEGDVDSSPSISIR